MLHVQAMAAGLEAADGQTIKTFTRPGAFLVQGEEEGRKIFKKIPKYKRENSGLTQAGMMTTAVKQNIKQMIRRGLGWGGFTKPMLKDTVSIFVYHEISENPSRF